MDASIKAEKAYKLLAELNEIDVERYQQILQDRIGPELLSLFEQYCAELMPEEADEEAVGSLVHLMILGYLLSANEQSPVLQSLIQLV